VNQKGEMQILNELVFEPLICVGLCLLVFGGCELWSMELQKIYIYLYRCGLVNKVK